MKDPIERQDAIDALYHVDEYNARSVEVIRNLPPVQQHRRIFQEIVVEYPLNSPYLEYEGKPYFSIKYTENGQEFIGYGTYKLEVLSEYLKEYFMPSAQSEPWWIPCDKGIFPKDGKEALVTDGDNMMVAYYRDDAEAWDNYNFGWVEGRNEEIPYGINKVIAWMPLPKPYRGEEKNETD